MSKIKEICQKNEQWIIEEYKKYYSISEILKQNKLIQQIENNGFNVKSSRPYIEDILKRKNIYQGCGGLNSKFKFKKCEKTMIKKYGVKNISQLKEQKEKSVLLNNNKIKKNIIDLFGIKFNRYKKNVWNYSKKNKKDLLQKTYCYYTGIKFADCFMENVNPNDPLKRTLDHKIPIIIGFINNYSPENIGSVSNLCYCLRICNSIKGSTNLENFKPIAKHIREGLINEGYQSN